MINKQYIINIGGTDVKFDSKEQDENYTVLRSNDVVIKFANKFISDNPNIIDDEVVPNFSELTERLKNIII